MLSALAVVLALAPPAAAKVWVTAYRCDEMTPLAAVDPNYPTVYKDIMVGTRLALVVSSDIGEGRSGQLRLSWDDAEYATLSGREPVMVPGVLMPVYKGSCLDAAGEGAEAWDFNGPEGVGFAFSSGLDVGSPNFRPAVPGEWFIFDYHAERVGSCHVGLHDSSTDLDTPIETLSFVHVPSRDLDGDSIVNFEDLALFAHSWRSVVDADPNGLDAARDLNLDSRVDIGDLALFSEYWLEQTDCTNAVIDPNNPSPGL